MRTAKTILCIVSIIGASALAQRISGQMPASSKRIVIAASTALDGRGRVLHNTHCYSVIDSFALV